MIIYIYDIIERERQIEIEIYIYIYDKWQNMIVQPHQTHNHARKNMTTMGKVDTSDLIW